MKVLDVIRGDGGETGWRVLPDNVILNGKNPFFLPDFEGGVRCHPGIALRIGRLGKGISRRFARRYISELAPALIFRADTYAEILRRAGLPDSPAYSFDKAVVPFGFSPLPESEPSEIGFRFVGKDPKAGNRTRIEGDPDTFLFRDGGRITDTGELIDSAVESISRDNTLRMGDFILLSAPGPGLEVAVGDRPALETTITGADGETLLRQTGTLRIL